MSYKMFAYIEKQKPEPFLAIQEEYRPSESEEGEKMLDMNKEGNKGLSRNKSSTTKKKLWRIPKHNMRNWIHTKYI